jgi:hypothetical protein
MSHARYMWSLGLIAGLAIGLAIGAYAGIFLRHT